MCGIVEEVSRHQLVLLHRGEGDASSKRPIVEGWDTDVWNLLPYVSYSWSIRG